MTSTGRVEVDGIAPWSSCVGHLVWPGGQGAFTIGVGCVPSGYVKIAIENGPVEIVDLPSYKMVDLSIVM